MDGHIHHIDGVIDLRHFASAGRLQYSIMNSKKRDPPQDSNLNSAAKKPKLDLQVLLTNRDLSQALAQYTESVIGDVSKAVLVIFVKGDHRTYAMDWNDKDNVRVWEVLGTSNMFITTKLPPDDSPTSQLQTVIGEWNGDRRVE